MFRYKEVPTWKIFQDVNIFFCSIEFVREQTQNILCEGGNLMVIGLDAVTFDSRLRVPIQTPLCLAFFLSLFDCSWPTSGMPLKV